MIFTTEYIAQVVTDYFKDKPVEKVYLFGSYAKGNATEESDIDLLVDVDDKKKRISFLQLLKLNTELENIFNKKVELVEEAMIFPNLRESIISSKQLLFTR